MGRIEIVLRQRGDWPEVRDRLSRACGLANFSLARRGAARRRRAHRRHRRASAARRRSPSFRVDRAARRQAVCRCPRRSSSGSIGRRVQDARGWKVDLSNPAFVIGVEIVPGEAFYYFGKERGPGGLPIGHVGPRRGAAVRRHRLAGRGVADDEARLPRDARPLSQLSVPVAHVAGQGARAGAAADALSAALASVSRAVRRAAAPDHAERARSAARRRLSPHDVADRRAHRAGRARAGAGHRRRRRPGRVADAREPRGHLGGDDAAGPAAARSAWTRKRSRPRRNGSAPITISIIPDEDCCTLFTPRHPATRRHGWREWRPPRRRWPIERDGRRRGRPRPSSSSVPLPGEAVIVPRHALRSSRSSPSDCATGRLSRRAARSGSPAVEVTVWLQSAERRQPGSARSKRFSAPTPALLQHQCKTIPRDSLHLPGPDLVDRLFALTDRIAARARRAAADAQHRAARRHRLTCPSCRSTRASSTRPARRLRRTRRTSIPRTSSSWRSRAAATPWRRRSACSDRWRAGTRTRSRSCSRSTTTSSSRTRTPTIRSGSPASSRRSTWARRRSARRSTSGRPNRSGSSQEVSEMFQQAHELGHVHGAVVLHAQPGLQDQGRRLSPVRGSHRAGQPPRRDDRRRHHQAEAAGEQRRLHRGQLRQDAQGRVLAADVRQSDRPDALSGRQLLHGPRAADQLGRRVGRRRAT